MALLTPRRKRQLLSVVLGLVLVATATGANLVVGLERTALDADTVKEKFAEEGVYAELRTQMIASMQQGGANATASGDANGTSATTSSDGGPSATSSGPADVAGIDAPPIETVAESVVTREYVRSEVESSVDALYAYLHGERADLALEIDLQPIVEGFATEYEQWVLEAPVADLEPDWNVEGLNASMAEMAASEEQFRASRESFEERQRQRIQDETPRERSREELEAIYDDNRDRIRNELVSRIDTAVADRGTPEPLQEPVVGYASVGIDALVAEEITYQEFVESEQAAREPLATAVGEYVREGVGEEVPETMSLTEEMAPGMVSLFESARTLVWLSGIFQYVLPIGALLVAGLMGYTARRRSNGLWRVGGAVAVAGVGGFAAAIAGEYVLAESLGSQAGDVPAIGLAFLEVVRATVGAVGAQSIVILALGLALVAGGVAVRKDLLPIPDDPTTSEE